MGCKLVGRKLVKPNHVRLRVRPVTRQAVMFRKRGEVGPSGSMQCRGCQQHQAIKKTLHWSRSDSNVILAQKPTGIYCKRQSYARYARSKRASNSAKSLIVSGCCSTFCTRSAL